MLKSILFYCLFLTFAAFCSGCDVRTSPPLKQWPLSPEGSYGAAISEDGQLALISTLNHGLQLWDLNLNKPLYQWQHGSDGTHQVFLLFITANKRYALSAGRSDFVVWDIQTGKAKGYWEIGQSSIRDIAISANGEQVLAGLGDGKVLHINLATGRRLEFLGHNERINSVALSANGRFALTGGNDYQAILWDTQTAQVIKRFPHDNRVTKVALENDGRYAFTADSMKDAVIWDLSTGKKLSQLHFKSRQLIFSSVNFAKEGSWLVTGSPSRKIALWDTRSGQKLQEWFVTPNPNVRPSSAVVFDAKLYNPATLVSSSSSGLTELWQINTKN